jgi:branched-chain amino acid aminotransferase
MENFIININQEIFDETTAKISVLDRGFLYGDSVYEATRTFNRRPFRLDQHIDRLFSSAEKIYLEPTLSKQEIITEIQKTISASTHENVSIRIILTRGDNSDLGLDPELASSNNLVIITKEIKPNPAWWYENGVAMIFYQKKSSNVGPLPKAGNYIENMLAYREAKQKSAFDSIMINPEGFVSEGTTSNIWMVKNNCIYTPPLSVGILEGLTRKTLLEIMPTIEEKKLTPEDFLAADECFISSTTRDLIPVISIDNHKIGTGAPGPKTTKLLSLYRAYVTKDR